MEALPGGFAVVSTCFRAGLYDDRAAFTYMHGGDIICASCAVSLVPVGLRS